VTTFVIVHGACGGGWEWRRVADTLRAEGHEAHTPTLTGLGERSHLLSPDITLETHVTDVANVLVFEDLSDVVLVGHSYGGMVIVAVADRLPERIRHLVCIDGFVPLRGQSSQDLSDPGFFEEMIAEPARTQGEWWFVPAWIDDEMNGWYRERATDHPLRTLTDPVPLTRAHLDVTGTYVQCVWPDKDPTFWEPSRANARLLGWDHRTIESPHDVAIANPSEIAALLSSVARAAAAAAAT
jgi:pimeloyl-ACP methyl ester carboxylesterase